MNRRSFIHGVASILGLSVVVSADETVKQVPQLHEGTVKNGPYCVEIQGSHIWTERGLPLFDTIQQAQSFAIARMNIMRSMDEKSGIILVTTPNGDQIQTCTWDTYSSTVVSYADGRGNFFS